MENKEMMKKDLAKLCKAIRTERLNNGEYDYTIPRKECVYPKAIMTARQMELNTASINFGSRLSELREKILHDERLQQFIEKWNIKQCYEETTSFHDLIIRLRY